MPPPNERKALTPNAAQISCPAGQPLPAAAAAAPSAAPDAAPPRPRAPPAGLRGAARDAEIQREMERERERLWQRRREMSGQVELERGKVLAMQAAREQERVAAAEALALALRDEEAAALQDRCAQQQEACAQEPVATAAATALGDARPPGAQAKAGEGLRGKREGHGGGDGGSRYTQLLRTGAGAGMADRHRGAALEMHAPQVSPEGLGGGTGAAKTSVLDGRGARLARSGAEAVRGSAGSAARHSPTGGSSSQTLLDSYLRNNGL